MDHLPRLSLHGLPLHHAPQQLLGHARRQPRRGQRVERGQARRRRCARGPPLLLALRADTAVSESNSIHPANHPYHLRRRQLDVLLGPARVVALQHRPAAAAVPVEGVERVEAAALLAEALLRDGRGRSEIGGKGGAGREALT